MYCEPLGTQAIVPKNSTQTIKQAETKGKTEIKKKLNF